LRKDALKTVKEMTLGGMGKQKKCIFFYSHFRNTRFYHHMIVGSSQKPNINSCGISANREDQRNKKTAGKGKKRELTKINVNPVEEN
jgi:hypothetical protein